MATNDGGVGVANVYQLSMEPWRILSRRVRLPRLIRHGPSNPPMTSTRSQTSSQPTSREATPRVPT